MHRPADPTKPWLTCSTCGAATQPSGIFFVCTSPTCVENPASEAARIDRRATIQAVEDDGYAGEGTSEDDDDE